MYGEDTITVKINRFDVDLYKYLLSTDPDRQVPLKGTRFLDIYAQEILNIGKADTTGFEEKLNAFFSNPELMLLYKDEQEILNDITPFEKELSSGFSILLKEFPSLKMPEIFMHVSGLNQNIIVADSILSLSGDKYLGKDYVLYQDFFYDYQRELLSPDRIVPDYLLGFLMSEFPFQGNPDVLLDRMIYEGKLRYILSCLLPKRPVWESLGYSEDQYNWCLKNESRIWKTILEKQQLYASDYLVTSQYINEAPHTAPLTLSSPARVGIWVGFRIISSYIKNQPQIFLSELMELSDYQDLLKNSKYKP